LGESAVGAATKPVRLLASLTLQPSYYVVKTYYAVCVTEMLNTCGVAANGIVSVPVAVVPSGAVAVPEKTTLVLGSPAGIVTSNWSGTVASGAIVTLVSDAVSVGVKT
jgi:hypothetical protein